MIREEIQRQWCFFRSGARTLKSCHSRDYACDNKYTIYVPMIYASKWKRKTSMLAKKHPFTCSPAAKHQNAANSGLQTYKKKPVNLFYGTAQGSTLYPKVSLLKFLCKSFHSCRIYNSLFCRLINKRAPLIFYIFSKYFLIRF